MSDRVEYKYAGKGLDQALKIASYSSSNRPYAYLSKKVPIAISAGRRGCRLACVLVKGLRERQRNSKLDDVRSLYPLYPQKSQDWLAILRNRRQAARLSACAHCNAAWSELFASNLFDHFRPGRRPMDFNVAGVTFENRQEAVRALSVGKLYFRFFP